MSSGLLSLSHLSHIFKSNCLLAAEFSQAILNNCTIVYARAKVGETQITVMEVCLEKLFKRTITEKRQIFIFP